MAFGSPDNCRLSDLGLIAAGNGSSTSGSATSEKRLRADCANSSSATNVRLWDSFKSPTQSQMMSGTVLDDDPEDDTYEVDTNDSSVGGSVTTDSPSTYGIGTYFMSRCWNLNTTFIQNTWEAVISNNGGSNIAWYIAGEVDSEPLGFDYGRILVSQTPYNVKGILNKHQLSGIWNFQYF